MLGDHDAVALDVVFSQAEAVLEHGDQGGQVIRLAARRMARITTRQVLEAGAEVSHGLAQDHEQAMLLGLEIVVERGRANSYIGGDVRPLGVLVAVPPEPPRGGIDDLVSLGAFHWWRSLPRGQLRSVHDLNSYQ